jgi:hypothetical protein
LKVGSVVAQPILSLGATSCCSTAMFYDHHAYL